MAYKVKIKKKKIKEAEEAPTKAKIKYTKRGQPYIIDPKTGRARFIKKTKK